MKRPVSLLQVARKSYCSALFESGIGTRKNPKNACLALGTGDIDCVYYFALPELINAVAGLGSDDSANLVKVMVDGKRLSDLPLDLAV